MADMITIRGYAVGDVVLRSTQKGEPMATLRIGSTERRVDKLTNEWVDGHTNWFTVTMFRALAQNVASSIHKGDRLIVTGKLRVKNWLREDGRTGTSVDIEADSIGTDLFYGTCHYRRNSGQRQESSPYAMNDGGANGHFAPDFAPGADDGDQDDNGLPEKHGGGEDVDVEVEDGSDVTEDGESADKETGELAGVPY